MAPERQWPREPKNQSSPPPTRKRSRKEFKSKQFVEGSDEDQMDDPHTVEALKKRRTTPDPVASDELDPCERCLLAKVPCHPNRYRKACVACRTSKQTCSHAKLTRSSLGLQPKKARARKRASGAPHNPPPPPDLNVAPAPYSHQVIKVKRKRGLDDQGEASPSKILKLRIPASTAGDAASRPKVTPSGKGEILRMFILLIL